ncbi:MAG: nickel pincer cofactor biosynthesis protein LarC [Candidatus Korobacteraceae bacterium]
MRVAYLDCFSGISGDMFLGALVDAGVPARLLEQTVADLNLGATLEITRVSRSGISATKVDVFVRGEKELPREQYWAGKKAADHSHAEEHSHSRASSHSHDHEATEHQHHHHDHADHDHVEEAGHHSHAHGRGLAEIKAIIANAAISDAVKRIATSAFDALGAAESKIHNTSLEAIHFHEVGAVDAIVDVVCGAVGADALGVDRWICSPLNVGGGTVECAHGRFPIPAPATLELLQGAPVYSSGAQVELVTPTGAALVRALAQEFCAFPSMTVFGVGYGAGTRDLKDAANVLRITIGELQEETRLQGAHLHAASSEVVSVLEASVDDLNPQVFGYVMDRALAEGALDVFAAPLHMKKNRPGMLLTVLARPQQAEALARLLFAETTTLGVRVREERRWTLDRRWEQAQTPWGSVRVKVASLNGTLANYAPEYEDCRRLAEEHGVPLKSVMQEAMKSYLSNVPGQEQAAGGPRPKNRGAKH